MKNKSSNRRARGQVKQQDAKQVFPAETGLVTYKEFGPLLPVPVPRRKILDMSLAGHFPKFTRPAGARSEPVFNKGEVLAWVNHTFGEIVPELVARIDRWGVGLKTSDYDPDL